MTQHVEILDEVLGELRRQDEKWVPQRDHHPLYWLAILTEEFGEVGKALTEGNRVVYRAELVHVAAVAAQMALAFDRTEAPDA
jgi:NTP pyrophosphatase (non-canonical NTP hydrolase)